MSWFLQWRFYESVFPPATYERACFSTGSPIVNCQPFEFFKPDGWDSILIEFEFTFFLLVVKLNIFHMFKGHFSISFCRLCLFLIFLWDFWSVLFSIFKVFINLGDNYFTCDVHWKYFFPACHVFGLLIATSAMWILKFFK